MFTPAQINTIARRAHHAIEGKGEGHTVYRQDRAMGRYIVGGIGRTPMLATGTPVASIRQAIHGMIATLRAEAVVETLGYWEDGGTVYVDLGDTWTSRARALQVAARRGELAIYDREAGECITVPAAHVCDPAHGWPCSAVVAARG